MYVKSPVERGFVYVEFYKLRYCGGEKPASCWSSGNALIFWNWCLKFNSKEGMAISEYQTLRTGSNLDPVSFLGFGLIVEQNCAC